MIYKAFNFIQKKEGYEKVSGAVFHEKVISMAWKTKKEINK